MSNFILRYAPNCPIDVFNNPNLNNNEKVIFMVIHNIIGSNERKCTLTNEDLANASSTNKRTVIRAIQKLLELELIWTDIDRKRASNNVNEAVRHIYTNYKYYTDRNKKEYTLTIPTFKSHKHFINWCNKYAQGFESKITKEDGATVPIKINERGRIENTILKKEYSPSSDRELIYFVWDKLYKNHKIVTDWVLKKQNQIKEQK